MAFLNEEDKVSIPDPLKRTVRIPVRWNAGVPELLHGGPLPEISDGAVGDLTIAAFQIQDPEIREMFSVEAGEILIGKEERLLVHVSHRGSDDRVLRLTLPYAPGTKWAGFVPIETREPLVLRLRGTKDPVLEPCTCWIPALEAEAGTLNEAYTRISETLEPDRRSHTGNVFRKVLFLDGQIDIPENWLPLERLRERAVYRFESQYGKNLVRRRT